MYKDVCNTERGLQLWNKVDTYLLHINLDTPED